MRRIIALVFVVAVFVSAALAPVAGADPGKNPPNGNGPLRNPSPQSPNGSPRSCDNSNGHGWMLGVVGRCVIDT